MELPVGEMSGTLLPGTDGGSVMSGAKMPVAEIPGTEMLLGEEVLSLDLAVAAGCVEH